MKIFKILPYEKMWTKLKTHCQDGKLSGFLSLMTRIELEQSIEEEKKNERSKIHCDVESPGRSD